MSDTIGNYEPKFIPKRSGPGEGGKRNQKFINSWLLLIIQIGVPVLLSAEEERKAQATITQYGFNMVASDKISMDRNIKDTRPAEYIFLKKNNNSSKIKWTVFPPVI